MKKLIFLALIVIFLSSTLISAKVIEDTNYGLLQATKYTNDNMIRTQTRAGVIETYDPNTGKIMITTRKNEGGIKTKEEIGGVSTPVIRKTPLRNDVMRLNEREEIIASQQTNVITQGQALQRIQRSDLVSGQVVSDLPLKEQNPVRILFSKIWSFLKG